MTKREAQAVARQISKTEGVRVEGYRIEPTRGGANYEINCVDTQTGYPFIVRSREEWLARRAAVEYAALIEGPALEREGQAIIAREGADAY